MRPTHPKFFDPPGGILIWLIVLVELLTFGIGLIVFAVQRKGEPLIFAQGRSVLSQPIALANTLILLTGGWFMANGMACVSQGNRVKAARWTVAASLSGLAFLALKTSEYFDKIAHEHTLGSDSFYTLYWLLTGFHFVHVGVAVVILALIGWKLRQPSSGGEEVANVEAGGIFWHLCDLVWLLLYPTLYLLA